MKNKPFAPLLAPNDAIKLTDIPLPTLVSFKLDGIRCIIKDGQMYSRALKQFPNVKLYERFEHLMRFSKENNIILDGELLAKSLTFNELSGITRQLDKELPDDLNFYCFDCIKAEDFNLDFQTRYLMTMLLPDMQYFEHLTHKTFHTCEEIEAYYTQALEWGCDGLILRNPKGIYKFGRATIKENIIYKLKPFQTFDSKVKYVIQATEVRAGAEKKINELGRSVTSKKKDDRVLIEKASAFLVDYNGLDLKVTIAMSDKEKEEIWKNKESYIGKYVEYKGMLVGMKEGGLPRHPTSLRLRYDRD